MHKRTFIQCKDCSAEVSYTDNARDLDIARGLSAPERCPKCRKKNREEINSAGQSYWQPKVETDDKKRCWGKFGLGRLERDRPPARDETYTGVPVDAPLLWLKNPKDPAINPEQLKLAEKFSKIAPVAEKLIANLTDPDGKRVTVLVGPTGTGKSTWVPYRLLRSPIGEQGRIVVTQPRTITLRQEPGAKDPTTTPGFIASKLMGLSAPWLGPGQEVGFQYKEEKEMKDAYTKLLFVTDGTLINWIQSGEIGAFSVVVIDEAHEQSENMELIFALLKHRMALYPHMRLVIASATVDVEKFRGYFGGGDPNSVFLAAPDDAEALAKGTPKVIHDRWMSGNTDSRLDFEAHMPEVAALKGVGSPNGGAESDVAQRLKLLPAAIAAVVKAICTAPVFSRLGIPKGDILVFLPRVERDMMPVEEAINALGLNLDIHQCHAQMKEFARFKQSEAKAEQAMERGQPTNPQRVLLATTYAETSITMSNLRYVIDTGLILQPSWDPETCSTAFKPQWHSQDGCMQRRGRVGRVQEGECFRLYTKAEYDKMLVHTRPEITRVPLDNFLIKAKAAGIDDLETFDWLGKTKEQDTSDAKEIRRAVDILKDRGVVDIDGDITHRGVELSGFQTGTVDLALCMSESDAFGCTLEMATFLAFLAPSQSPFKRGESGAVGYLQWSQGCHDDLELYLRLYHQWATFPALGTTKATWLKKRTEWFESQGVNASFLSAVEDGLQNLVKNLSPKTHDSVTWRDLDLKRLHRLRLIIGRTMQDWIYSRDSQTGAYQPRSPKCPCREAVRIDRDSSCLAIKDIQSFVCIGRSRLGQSILAKHIVRIDDRWLPHLATGSPVALAVMLRDSLRIENDIANRTPQRVTAKPRPIEPLRAQANQRITFRVVRTVSSEAESEKSKSFLCEDTRSGQFGIVAFESDEWFNPGAVFDAEVKRVIGARVIVTQEPIVAELMNGKLLTGTVVDVARNPKDDAVDGLFVEISPPGIQGRLLQHSMGVLESKQLLQAKPGQQLEVVVVRREAGRWILATRAVAEGRRRQFDIGEKLQGIVVRAVKGGLRVEVVPGVVGFLPAGALGRAASDRATSMKPEELLTVEVRQLPGQNNHGDVILQIPKQKFAIGQTVKGTVVGFAKDTRGYGPPSAFVELAPGVDGVLYHKNAPRNYINTLRQGQAVTVRILGPRQNGRDGYELAC